MASRLYIPTKVVSGFPAIGKSFIAKKFPTMVRDLESSDYHWNKELEEGNVKVVKDDWPNNYISDIKALDKSGMYKNIMVSSHELIRRKMAEAGIKYTNVFPENTPAMKKLILERCRIRHNTDEFIENLDKNWDSYIDSLLNDKGATCKVQINRESIEMWQTWMLME